MSERLIDIVAVSDHPGESRWHAVAPCGSVAGVAAVRPLAAPGLSFLPPPDPAAAVELSLVVEPDWRRRGIGSRLLAAARDRVGAPGLVTDVTEGSPGEAFCLRHGFRRAGSRRRDLLTYCDVHRAWLGELVDTEHPGYHLTHPSDDPVLTTAHAGDDLAAYAVAVVGAASQPRARQYGPVVLPGHRGHGLGLWVNAALIQRLSEIHPHVTEIETATDEDDPALLAVREHLGFRALGHTRRYTLGSA
ncbi:GNAT family N-acetyltransferase [Actinoplanes sp. NPDC024001]|uniref:GNAT family N-acetyltransferase n=1 Tax=Actinoplanes sp. NPDC024001 TaxID=3154598 RepID=UPI0033E03627